MIANPPTRTKEEYIDILSKMRKHKLKFLHLIELTDDDAIKKLEAIDDKTYETLVHSVNFYEYKKDSRSRIALRPTTENKKQLPVAQNDAYEMILKPGTPIDAIPPAFRTLRAAYLNELKTLENTPGCSACQKGRLRRKYIELLKKIDKQEQ